MAHSGPQQAAACGSGPLATHIMSGVVCVKVYLSFLFLRKPLNGSCLTPVASSAIVELTVLQVHDGPMVLLLVESRALDGAWGTEKREGPMYPVDKG